MPFTSKLERVQYKSCLTITGAIQGKSRERLKELDLESLSDRRWVRKLTFIYRNSERKFSTIFFRLLERKQEVGDDLSVFVLLTSPLRLNQNRKLE